MGSEGMYSLGFTGIARMNLEPFAFAGELEQHDLRVRAWDANGGNIIVTGFREDVEAFVQWAMFYLRFERHLSSDVGRVTVHEVGEAFLVCDTPREVE